MDFEVINRNYTRIDYDEKLSVDDFLKKYGNKILKINLTLACANVKAPTIQYNIRGTNIIIENNIRYLDFIINNEEKHISIPVENSFVLILNSEYIINRTKHIGAFIFSNYKENKFFQVAMLMIAN